MLHEKKKEPQKSFARDAAKARAVPLHTQGAARSTAVLTRVATRCAGREKKNNNRNKQRALPGRDHYVQRICKRHPWEPLLTLTLVNRRSPKKPRRLSGVTWRALTLRQVMVRESVVEGVACVGGWVLHVACLVAHFRSLPLYCKSFEAPSLGHAAETVRWLVLGAAFSFFPRRGHASACRRHASSPPPELWTSSGSSVVGSRCLLTRAGDVRRLWGGGRVCPPRCGGEGKRGLACAATAAGCFSRAPVFSGSSGLLFDEQPAAPGAFLGAEVQADAAGGCCDAAAVHCAR